MSLKVQPGPGYDNYLGDVEISLNNLAASGSKMATKSARLLALKNLVRSCTEAEVNELLAPLREVVLSSTTPVSLSLKFSVPVSDVSGAAVSALLRAAFNFHDTTGDEGPDVASPKVPTAALRRDLYLLLLALVADPLTVYLVNRDIDQHILEHIAAMHTATCAADLQGLVRTPPPHALELLTRFTLSLLVAWEDADSSLLPVLHELKSAVADVCLCAVSVARNFDKVYDQHISEMSREYERLHRDGLSPSQGAVTSCIEEGQRTGHFYPGRAALRPGVRFTKDRAICNKAYPTSSVLSAGLVVSTCTCSHPIIAGFSVMTCAESLGFVWTVLIVYFSHAAHIFYDSGCNLFQSVIIRMKWALKGRRILTDRFHGEGHTCGPGFDAAQCENAVDDRTSSAESVNALLATVRASVRYIRPSNLVSFIAMRAMYINLCARWRFETGRADTEGAELNALGNRLMPCYCQRCVNGRENSRAFVSLEKRYVSNIISTQAFSATEMIAAMAEVRGTSGCEDFT
jgi:hypothetical protein